MLWISGLPLPPSANGMYETNVHKKWTRNSSGKPVMKVKTSRRCSDALKTFQLRCELFRRQNPALIQECSNQCKMWISYGFMLSMDSYCAFESSRLWTKAEEPKQIDADNYRKALQDAVFKILGIDDKYVFHGNIEKVSCINKDLECSIVAIKPVKPRSLTEIQIQMGSSQPT